MSDQHLQFERKFSEIDRALAGVGTQFREIETARVIEKTAVEARTKQRNQGFTAIDKAVGLALLCIPIIITLARG